MAETATKASASLYCQETIAAKAVSNTRFGSLAVSRSLPADANTDNAPAIFPGSRAEVDHVIARRNDAHVMFDDDYGITTIDQPVEL